MAGKFPYLQPTLALPRLGNQTQAPAFQVQLWRLYSIPPGTHSSTDMHTLGLCLLCFFCFDAGQRAADRQLHRRHEAKRGRGMLRVLR
eukprot:3180674-Rhodomonas_salina.1